MTSPSAEPVAGLRLRANPGYELVLLDRLPPAERRLVAEHAGGDGERLYGVLRPRRGSALDARTVDADAALLFLTLAAPAPLPAYARAQAGAEAAGVVARLVLDDVLQLEHEGAFVGGAAAAPLLVAARSRGGRGRVGALTEAALRYGQELTDLPRELLARRLYGYGTRPASPRLRARLRDDAGIAAASGLGEGGPAAAAVRAGWEESAAGADAAGAAAHWRQWGARRADPGSVAAMPACKLYVSPALDGLPEAVAAVAELLAGPRGAVAFKLGRDVPGLCRPDKLVAYFERLDDLRAGAERLRERLDGCPAQGVPFTAAIDADGLLSWGADPPALAGAGATSWRMWVARQLADLLVDGARAAGAPVEPWRFALDRLRLAGVDTDRWIPAPGMWPDAAAG